MILILVSCLRVETSYETRVFQTLRDSVLLQASESIRQVAQTVTHSACIRSAGGRQDYYSEGDYWWQDTTNLEGPYIRRDGMTNPENFTDHRDALMRFSEIVGNLTSAYLITGDTTFSNAAKTHCHAWFINKNTKMNPHLLYAQAIKGRHTGRGIGIIDGIHLMEVVQSLRIMEENGLIKSKDLIAYKKWFAEFVTWLTTHPYGKDEMTHPNNHGTCWNMQVGLYALFTNNESVLSLCRERYKNELLPKQMISNGSFPKELSRTKPYGYSLFNLDAMTMNCLILSTKTDNLWQYHADENKSLLQGISYMEPFVRDKASWPFHPDVMYWENWPVAHPSFLFSSMVFDNPSYFELWQGNTHFHEEYEVKRNLPIRNPLLWLRMIPK